MKKALALLLLMALAILPVFGGGTTEGTGKIPTIRFMSGITLDEPVGRSVVMENIIEDSKEWAEIIFESAPASDELYTKIQTEAAAGTLPEIFTYWPGSRLNVLIDGGLIADVEDYLKVSQTVKYNSMDESVWNLFRWNGFLGGVPTNMISGAFLVNRKLFEKYGLEYPETYEDMVAVGKVFRENDINSFAMASFEGNPSHFWYTIVQFQYEDGLQDVLDMDKTYQFDTPRTRQTAKMMARMKQDGLYPKDTMSNGQWGPCTALYIEGKAAMIFTYPWMYGNFEEDLANATDIIEVPRMPGATVDPHSAINSESNYGIVMSKEGWNDPDKQDAIRKIVDAWVSKEAAVEFQYALDELFAGTVDPDEYVDRVLAVFDEGKAMK